MVEDGGDGWKKFDIFLWEKVIILMLDRMLMVCDYIDFLNMYVDEVDFDGGIFYYVEVNVVILFWWGFVLGVVDIILDR